MTPNIRNPFLITGYVSPQYFCDREQETRDMTEAIENGRNIALISPRRMGKTGLIEHCFNTGKISKGYHTFFIDIYSTGSLKEFVFLLGKHIFESLKPRGKKFTDRFVSVISSLRPAIKIDQFSGLPTFDIGIGEISQPEVTLEQIFDYLESADKRCIVAIDEFQQIARYPEKNIEAILRTHIQRCKNANFIFAGSQQHMMQDIFFTASRPFYQSVSLMTLGPISFGNYLSFVTGFFDDAHVKIRKEDIKTIYDLFEGHTWYMQYAFNKLYSIAAENETITEELIYYSIKNVVYSFDLVYQGILSNLPERQKEVLYAIAKEIRAKEITSADFIRRHGLKSSSSVQAAARQLVAREIISKEDNNYYVSDRFFGLWIMEEYGQGIHTIL